MDKREDEPLCFHDSEMTRFFFDWSEPHHCAGTDWIIIFYLWLIVHAISWWGRWLVWEPGLNWLARKHPSWTREKCSKCSTHLTEALFFVLSGVFSWKIIASKRWCYDMSLWPLSKIQDYTVDPDLKFFYLLYSARFISDTISLFYEDRPKDSLMVSFIHHFVALSLLHGVAYWGYTRSGSLVMLYFDWADPPLLVAKCCRHLSKAKHDFFDILGTRLFEIFVITFLLTRNGIYNYMLYRALRPETFPVSIEYHVIQAFLVALALLQTYWLVMIVQAIMRMLKTGNVDDVRDIQEKVLTTADKRDEELKAQ